MANNHVILSTYDENHQLVPLATQDGKLIVVTDGGGGGGTVELGATSLAALETIDLGATSLAALETINALGPLTNAELRAAAVPVDTELGAAIAAADNIANPTAPIVLAQLMGWDTTQLRRVVIAADGSLLSAPGISGTLADAQSNTAANLRMSNGSSSRLAISSFVFDGTNWNRQRGNNPVAVFSPTSRTATVQSSDLTNWNGRGIFLFVNVTAVPAGTETLSLKLQAKDPVLSSTYTDLVDFGVIWTAGTDLAGMKCYLVGPGMVGTDLVSSAKAKQAMLPLTVRAVVTHSGASSWSYGVNCVITL